jgi:hypothetical protein
MNYRVSVSFCVAPNVGGPFVLLCVGENGPTYHCGLTLLAVGGSDWCVEGVEEEEEENIFSNYFFFLLLLARGTYHGSRGRQDMSLDG